MSWKKPIRQLLNLVAANYRVDALEKELGLLREQFDAFRSSLEVPTEMTLEYANWKTRTRIPDRPLVSICMATFNRGRMLTERSIASVLAQTYKKFELIIVGDGCTDDTENRINSIGDERITFVNLPQRGQYPEEPVRRWMVAGTPAMNRCMQLAKGDFVTHLDDDDEYLPERLERLVDFSIKNQSDFVWHPFWVSNGTDWYLHEAKSASFGNLTTGSVFYRSWFKRIEWSMNAHYVLEPGDWNRFRRIKFVCPQMVRYGEPLLKHYRERNQSAHKSFLLIGQ